MDNFIFTCSVCEKLHEGIPSLYNYKDVPKKICKSCSGFIMDEQDEKKIIYETAFSNVSWAYI